MLPLKCKRGQLRTHVISRAMEGPRVGDPVDRATSERRRAVFSAATMLFLIWVVMDSGRDRTPVRCF